MVIRYRISLEQQHYASTTINLRLAAVRRLAYEAADCGLLSADLAAGIRRVKGIDAWMTASGIEVGILLRSINKAGRVWGCGFSPKVIWGVVKEKARICEIQLWRPMTSVELVPVFVIKQVGSWSRFNSCWDMSLCRQPSDISDASSASTTLPMIGSGSNRIGRDYGRSTSLADIGPNRVRDEVAHS